MTLSNWIELAVILIAAIPMSIILIKVSRKVNDLDGAEVICPEHDEDEDYDGIYISS